MLVAAASVALVVGSLLSPPGSAPSLSAEPQTRRVVMPPRGAPEPRQAFPDFQPPATGRGGNPSISRIPQRVWRSMVGVSWSRGCVPRSHLRYLTVNYWGFDGVRYRGELIVHRSVARSFASALSELHELRYPIRTMTLVDRFGKAPGGNPGANDYRSMRADNTSAFNCRYAVGLEGARRWSSHARGTSIDINPWENPDSQGRPDGWYLGHRHVAHPAILGPRSRATRAFTSRGWTWGGRWNSVDYQHFQR